MPNLRRVGREAEDEAAKFLLKKGYTIVTRRFTTKHGEIDLIALDGDVLVFVEVKSRRAKDYVPEEAMNPAKIRALGSAARVYIRQMGEDRQVRYDFIGIDADGIRHYPDAFRVGDEPDAIARMDEVEEDD